jgi:hypothetical protein
MIVHDVRVNNRQELDDWLRSNIPSDQAMGWVRVICPDKTAKDSSLVSELQAGAGNSTSENGTTILKAIREQCATR